MTHHVDLDTITLGSGSHPDAKPGDWCVMEAVAYFAHEPWSDHPACVSTVIGAFLRRWNDDLDDEGRQRLVPLIPKVVGTNTGKADEERRAWMVTDWMVRAYMPAWLDLAGLGTQATSVRSLPALDGPSAWKEMAKVVQQARSDAHAAWAAAGDAAGTAAGDAAWAAAWAAAGAAVGDAAGAAAWAAVGAAAWDAAGAAAWAAAWDAAGAAAGAAVGDALRPTVEGLQESALRLLDDLIAVGQPT